MTSNKKKGEYRSIPIKQHVMNCSMTSNEILTASSMLDKPDWLEKVNYCFNKNNKMKAQLVSEELKSKANSVQRVLNIRLTKHLNNRVANPKIRNHWSFLWARKNFPIISAIMTRYNQVKDDVLLLDENATLLKPRNMYIPVQKNALLLILLHQYLK